MTHSSVVLPIAVALSLITAPGSRAQQAGEPERLAFQNASVATTEHDDSRCAPNRSVGREFNVTNCPLGELILFAYDVLQEQVSSKSPLLEEHFDVTATAAQPVSRSQVRRMLQTLLQDRFKLTLRRETRNIPVYALVTAPDGPKFQPSQNPPDEGPKRATGSKGQFILQNAVMSDIVFALSRRISDRIIVDKTGLDGRYDLDMTWYLALGKPDPPSVFDAVKQTGLSLEPQTSPVDYLVIEHVELPSGTKKIR